MDVARLKFGSKSKILWSLDIFKNTLCKGAQLVMDRRTSYGFRRSSPKTIRVNREIYKDTFGGGKQVIQVQ
jgi:hypothetical protein